MEGLEDCVAGAWGAGDAQGVLEGVPEAPHELLAEFLPEECFFEVHVFLFFFPLMLDVCASCEFLDTDTLDRSYTKLVFSNALVLARLLHPNQG